MTAKGLLPLSAAEDDVRSKVGDAMAQRRVSGIKNSNPSDEGWVGGVSPLSKELTSGN